MGHRPHGVSTVEHSMWVIPRFMFDEYPMGRITYHGVPYGMSHGSPHGFTTNVPWLAPWYLSWGMAWSAQKERLPQ